MESSSQVIGCHGCNSHDTELIPISTNESFRINYNLTRGMEMEFYRSNDIVDKQPAIKKHKVQAEANKTDLIRNATADNIRSGGLSAESIHITEANETDLIRNATNNNDIDFGGLSVRSVIITK